MLADTETVLAALQQIHDLGVGIALDDFGTGYSSLSYLRCFPFNKVKIDRSFVMDLGRQSGADTITAAIIGLCVRLGLRITAEGVETEDQLERLANLHCTEAQGYLFNRPRPACDVPDMLIRPAAPLSETIGHSSSRNVVIHAVPSCGFQQSLRLMIAIRRLPSWFHHHAVFEVLTCWEIYTPTPGVSLSKHALKHPSE